MWSCAMILSVLAATSTAPAEAPSHTPEQLATGAIREIISAQAVHRQMSPQVGYACSLERLVETQLLLDVWLAGQRVEGYAFRVWCEAQSKPQATYRASAVPVKKGIGATLTVCADERNVPRTFEGDAAACLEKGAAPPAQ